MSTDVKIFYYLSHCIIIFWDIFPRSAQPDDCITIYFAVSALRLELKFFQILDRHIVYCFLLTLMIVGLETKLVFF